LTVHSIDRSKPGKTKLDRLSKCANSYKDAVFNNLGHIIDEDLLKQVYQKLESKRAIGVDGVNKETYGERLEENIKDLLRRIRNGSYHPKPSKLVEIPKEDGGKRPLAISCFEDKLVQSAVNMILTNIFEPLFLPCSHGFRPGRSCHDALRALIKHIYPNWNGAVVEIDISKYFNSIPHSELRKMLQKKISDERFLRLIDKLVTAPVLHDKKVTTNTQGCPQGSILSPILANIFLHEVIDEWFNTLKQNYFKRNAEEVRYADDMVFIFQNYGEAQRFFEVLPKRLMKYGLTMHSEKSHLIRSGQNVAEREHRKGRRLPTYQFLGFTVYWGKARNGKWWRVKLTSRRDRFTSKLKGLKAFLRKQLNTSDTLKILRLVASVLRGWLNYHGVSDNERRVEQFIYLCRKIIRKWINRRGRKRPMNWENFNKLMEKVNMPKTWKTASMFNTRGTKA
jgi:RNA-directed DNA polymerase